MTDDCSISNNSVGVQAAEADTKQPLEGGIDAPAAKKAKPAEAPNKPEVEAKEAESEEESGSEEESESEAESGSDEDSDEVYFSSTVS